MTTQYTPLPWVTQGNGKVLAASNTILIADCIPQNINFMAKNPDANAQRIVHCVNSHDELVEAVAGLLDAHTQLRLNGTPIHTVNIVAIEKAEAALAKAKGSAA
jgi:hypothetical protein